MALADSGADGCGVAAGFPRQHWIKNCTVWARYIFCVEEAQTGSVVDVFHENNIDDGSMLNAMRYKKGDIHVEVFIY